MENAEAEFKGLFLQAMALYPNPGVSEASVPAYWRLLRRYRTTVLRGAFYRACKSSPDFFPSAVRVREAADAAARTHDLPRVPETRRLDAPREYVPPVGAGAEAWIGEAKTPCESLARMWQVESKANGRDRGAEMPIEIGKRRFAELSRAFEIQQAAAETRRQQDRRSRRASTSGPPRTGNDSPSTPSGSSASQPSTESSAGALSHGACCVCELCMPAHMERARKAGLA